MNKYDDDDDDDDDDVFRGALKYDTIRYEMLF